MADRFVWYELMTTDKPAAEAFYASVFGWGTQPGPVPDMPYTLFAAGDAPFGGVMALPQEARDQGAPPAWIGYVGVADVDACAARIAGLGGTVHVPPCDIPNVGRFAIVADPQMATFALWKCATGDAPPPPPQDRPCAVAWHELMAGDWEEAFGFYHELFGWTKAEAMDMGEMGTYQLFAADGPAIGGMFSKPPMVPYPFWLFYFAVNDFDAAVERVTAHGGQVIMGPVEVPGGGWIIQARDPQGAVFAMHGMR